MKIYQEAEQFINETFFTDSLDKSELKIVDLVNERLLQDEKEKDPEYFNQRMGVVHASKLYGCLRGAIHETLCHKKTSEIDARKLGVFKAGNLFEDFITVALGDRVIGQQAEYEYKYKSITLVGRSDYRINDNGVIRIGENKSVHSDQFWYRQKEGTLIQWHNQIQLQIYMWLERILPMYICRECGAVKFTNDKDTPECTKCKVTMSFQDKGEAPQGIFSYISKDDCTVDGCAIKFNQAIIDEVVIPSLDIVSAAYESKLPLIAEGKRLKELYLNPAEGTPEDKQAMALEINSLWKQINDLSDVPLPDPVVFNASKNQWQINWLAKYCDHHDDCAGKSWLVEAQDIMRRKNAELTRKTQMCYPHLNKEKPTISVATA